MCSWRAETFLEVPQTEGDTLHSYQRWSDVSSIPEHEALSPSSMDSGILQISILIRPA